VSQSKRRRENEDKMRKQNPKPHGKVRTFKELTEEVGQGE